MPENPKNYECLQPIRTKWYWECWETVVIIQFEMLGNFSIGDYFKNEGFTGQILNWCWMVGFWPRKIICDCFYPKDGEAKRIWRVMKLVLSEDHIIDVEDNPWNCYPSGPDNGNLLWSRRRILDIPEDDPENYPVAKKWTLIEIWNLVFSEFNHTPEDTYEPLPHKTLIRAWVETCCIYHSRCNPTNFETDYLCQSFMR